MHDDAVTRNRTGRRANDESAGSSIETAEPHRAMTAPRVLITTRLEAVGDCFRSANGKRAPGVSVGAAEYGRARTIPSVCRIRTFGAVRPASRAAYPPRRRRHAVDTSGLVYAGGKSITVPPLRSDSQTVSVDCTCLTGALVVSKRGYRCRAKCRLRPRVEFLDVRRIRFRPARSYIANAFRRATG